MTLIKRYQAQSSTYSDYDPESPAVFELVKNEIRKVIKDLDIQHTGSTAVPGLGGRNKIDLLVVGQKQEDYPQILKKLESVGLHDSGFEGIPTERPLRVGSLEHKGKTYFIHVHTTFENSDDHRKIIFFRDHLRSHPDDTEQYAKIKQKAVVGGSEERLQYNMEKHPFIQSILDKLDD